MCIFVQYLSVHALYTYKQDEVYCFEIDEDTIKTNKTDLNCLNTQSNDVLTVTTNVGL